MNPEWQDLDFIDLVSERHLQLREITGKLWNETSNIYISNSEWYILSRIYKKKPTIALVTKSVNISRQATHKFIKKLEAKGLVAISSLENNKKDKCIQLTPLGEECYEKSEFLKAGIEQQIAAKIGTDKLELLREILTSDWGLGDD
ncbi:MarR family transcriptional regulator [Bacillus sp. FJAT-27251]|uniref:winged helix DNA-binding protein n=1 Tax=Bacillus sp. FJAT-27251 TaxID=1684142 RepID=UPI0006A7DE2E|nr:MarR family transcriptional regulator [Bacillus sp. FJAT-27251]